MQDMFTRVLHYIVHSNSPAWFWCKNVVVLPVLEFLVGSLARNRLYKSSTCIVVDDIFWSFFSWRLLCIMLRLNKINERCAYGTKPDFYWYFLNKSDFFGKMFTYTKCYLDCSSIIYILSSWLIFGPHKQVILR